MKSYKTVCCCHRKKQESCVPRPAYWYCCTTASIVPLTAVIVPFDNSSGTFYCLWKQLCGGVFSTATFYICWDNREKESLYNQKNEISTWFNIYKFPRAFFRQYKSGKRKISTKHSFFNFRLVSSFREYSNTGISVLVIILPTVVVFTIATAAVEQVVPSTKNCVSLD